MIGYERLLKWNALYRPWCEETFAAATSAAATSAAATSATVSSAATSATVSSAAATSAAVTNQPRIVETIGSDKETRAGEK